MKKNCFSIHINAPKEKVWDTMLQDATYREWTSVFMLGSYFEGSWEKGEVSGMVSTIAENKPFEYISIQHVGVVKNGIEDATSDEAKKYAGFENYTFKSENNGTDVEVEMDSAEDLASYFEETWPKALQKLKEIAEK